MAGLASCASVQQPNADLAVGAAHYEIAVDQNAPERALVVLNLPRGAVDVALKPARDGDGSSVENLRCRGGSIIPRSELGWVVPSGCKRAEWTIRLDDIDAAGLDASLPSAAFSRRFGYWIIPEQDGLLRYSDAGGTVNISGRLDNGQTISRAYAHPSNTQPPFYAVIGVTPSVQYAHEGFQLDVFGSPPEYPWMEDIHRSVLETWARWRRDIVSGESPSQIDWAWVQGTTDMEPGYNASAGAEAIISQIRLREGDPDAEAKARAVIGASAAHEGFHTITGAAGQAWPAWVNESLANHFSIEAARRFLSPADFRFIEAFYIEPDVSRPLIEAQRAYNEGDGSQAAIFYTYGAKFWRAIEDVLTNEPNGSGRLAALIKGSNNFDGVNLTNAGALADFLDQHSAGRAGGIVACFLEGAGCPDQPS